VLAPALTNLVVAVHQLERLNADRLICEGLSITASAILKVAELGIFGIPKSAET
jgi:hypothetical protein